MTMAAQEAVELHAASDTVACRGNCGASMNHEALLNKIYGAVADPARWPDALTSISDQIDNVGGVLAYNARHGGKNPLVPGRLDRDTTTSFTRAMCGIHAASLAIDHTIFNH
jgi:hypothetical protein